MRHKPFIALILFFFLEYSLYGQKVTSLDSLKSLLESINIPKEQLKLHIKLSKEYSESNPDSGIYYAKLAINIVTQSADSSSLGAALAALSTAQSFKSDYKESIENAIKAIVASEIYHDTTSMIDASNTLGINFMELQDYQQSLDYFNKVKGLSILSNDSLSLGHVFNNFGLLQYYKGNITLELMYYKKAQVVFKNIGEQIGLGNTLLNIGTVYTGQDEYQKAEVFYFRAIEIFKKNGYLAAYANTLQSLSANYTENKKYNKALMYAHEALKFFEKNNYKYDISFCYYLIQQIHMSKGDFQSAYVYLKKYHTLEKDIFSENKTKQINDLQLKYHTQEQKQEIELLEVQHNLSVISLQKRRNNIIALIVFIMALISASIYVYISNKKKTTLQKQLLASEIHQLRTQVKNLIDGDILDIHLNKETFNSNLLQPLSDREFEILILAITDMSNIEIADKIFVSVNTVKFHMKNLYGKLGVSNRKEAKKFAFQTTRS